MHGRPYRRRRLKTLNGASWLSLAKAGAAPKVMPPIIMTAVSFCFFITSSLYVRD
jgi:hypothetical protein